MSGATLDANPSSVAVEHRKIGSFKLEKRSPVEMNKRCDDGFVSVSCFHPREPVIACGFNQVIVLSADDWCIPFSEWKQKKIKFEFNSLFLIGSLRWNVNGSRLAAGCNEGDVYVWAYPSAEIIFKVKEHTDWIDTLFWNPFNEHLFASLDILFDVTLWNSLCSDKKGSFRITGKVRVVEWVSVDKIAIGFSNGLIEIRQIDESKSALATKIIKQYKQEGAAVTGLAMNSNTQYLASCCMDGWIKVWSKESADPVYSLKTGSKCMAIAWQPSVKSPSSVRIDVARKALENFTLACRLQDNSILIWNPLEKDKVKKQKSLFTGMRPLVSFTFSPNGQFLTVLYLDPALALECTTFVFSTENWNSIFSCHCESLLGGPMSWMPTDLSEGAAYKLAISSCDNKINVIEAVAESGMKKK